jgi:hypothetical protein
MMCIEQADGKPVVRDDSPPLEYKVQDPKTKLALTYHYVKTGYVRQNHKFVRYYVLLDWLRNVMEIDMSDTDISGYGLTSLCAATANRLQVLRVSGCKAVDNRGMYAITSLCNNLRYLDVSVPSRPPSVACPAHTTQLVSRTHLLVFSCC